MTTCAWHESRTHYGIVLNTSPNRFDGGAATFGSIFIDQDDPNTLFLFYSGAQDTNWSHAAIGLATSNNGLEFRKASNNPVLEGTLGSFCQKEALTPAVTRINNLFFMIFSGRPQTKWSSRRLGIAWADDPRGPWHIIGELIKPAYSWEGRGIDNGPSIIKLNNETVLVFYSNVSSSWFATFLRRLLIRRIGILKLRIRGTSMSKIEVHRFPANPLKHFNGPKGSWNESLFCPGYAQIQSAHYLFPAASTYSARFPYRQYIGIISSNSPFFRENVSRLKKLIDGPSEKSLIIPHIKSEIALDTPAPLWRAEGKLFLYYSVMDRADGVWKIALTTFDRQELEQVMMR